MQENDRAIPSDDAADEETMSFHDSCGSDSHIIPGVRAIQEDVLELTDKDEYVDEP